ncbi:DNA-binding protein [Streptomyces sp. NPDC002746]
MDSTRETLLKELVKQKRWSYRDFVRAFEGAADRIGARGLTISEVTFRRWTAGKMRRLPNADACRALEAMFGVPAADLFKASSSEVSPPTLDLEAEIEMTARDAQNQAGEAASASISDTVVEQLRDDVHALARKYHTRPPFEILCAARDLREQAEHCRSRTQVPVQQQDLLILAGQTCAILATAAFDLGSLDNATRLARSAALYGETARFDPLRGFAGGTLAYIAYFSGRPSEAARLARQAAMLPGLGDVAHRRLAAIEARAYAHLGDTRSAQRALTLSTEGGNGVEDDLHDHVGGEFGFSAERLEMSNGTTCLLLGDGQNAEAAAQRALDLVTAKVLTARSLAIVGGAAADLAAARLIRDDLDGASEALTKVLEVPSDQRATGLLLRARQVRRSLTGARYQHTPLAGEMGEQLEDFVRVAQHQSSSSAGALEF